MVIDMGYWTRVAKRIIILILSLLVIMLSFKLAIFYMPFLIGFLISLIIEPIIRYIVKKTKLTRKTSAVVVLLILFTVIIGLLSFGIIRLISESNNLLQSLNMYIERIYTFIQEKFQNINFTKLKIPEQVINAATQSTDELINFVVDLVKNFLTSILQGITKLPIMGIYIVITILSTYFICTDKLYMLDQLEHHFPKGWVKKFGGKLKQIVSALGNYLKAELILVGISFIIVLMGLYIFKFIGLNVQYPLLAALGIGFVDALPILGSGTVMIPWAIISATDGNVNLSIGLFMLYVAILITRQIIEPKIVSNNIGIHPILTLIAMYTGFKLSGIIGLFIGPIILIILKNIFSTMIDDGIVKNILNRY